MAQVSLKTYEDQIRGLIEAQDFDKAITISQHVLQYYPKHLPSYSFLVEACLGKGFYEEAADLLLRVLAVDPESVSARAGLSQAYEARGDIADAITQMRMAFDLAPSLKQIHQNLQRLLQRESGELPPKLKLSRQGLGRIYLRGELYTQAADEFETLLRENPDQIDVEVSLAEALWRDGQRIRAVEVCQSILNKLPYCLKAHLILAETWMRSDREDEAETHIKFIREIDPDGELAYRFMGDVSPVAQASVTLPDLASGKPSPMGKQASPGFERTHLPQTAPSLSEDEESETLLGVAATSGGVGEFDMAEIPQWLQEARPAETQEEGWTASGSGISEDAGVPAWLTAAATVTADREEADELAETLETGVVSPVESQEEVVEEGVPEWLQRAVPQESVRETAEPTGVEEITPASTEEDGLLDWLSEPYEEEGSVSASLVEAVEEVAAEPAGEVAITEEELLAQEKEEPTWLRILRAEGLEGELPEGALAAMGAETAAEVSEVEEAAALEAEAEAEIEAGGVPAWLQELQAGEPLAEAAEEVAAEPAGEVAITEEELLAQEKEEPTWLRILRAEGLEGELPEDVLAAMGAETAAEVSEVEEAAALEAEAEAEIEAGGVPAWLQELQASEPLAEAAEEVAAEPAGEVAITEEELLAQEKEEPTWLRILRAEGLEGELPEDVLAAMGAETAAEVSEVEEAAALEAEAEAEIEAGGVPAWLQELQAGEPLAEAAEEVAAEPAGEVAITEEELLAQEKEEPTWLRILRAEGLEGELPEDVLAAMGAETAAEVSEVEEAAALEVEALEAEAEAEIEAGGVPAWLQELQAGEPLAEAAEEVAAEPVGEVAITEEELLAQEKEEPTWLRILRAEGLEGELPEDVLAAMGAETAAEVSEVEEAAALEVEALEAEAEAEIEAGGVPAWLQELQAGEPLAEAVEEVAAEPVGEVAITEEELLAQEKEEPTWLRILRAEGLEGELPEDVLAAMGAKTAAEVSEVEEAAALEAEAEAEIEAGGVPTWLQELQAGEPLAEAVEEVAAESEVRIEEKEEPAQPSDLQADSWKPEADWPSEASLIEVGLVDADLAVLETPEEPAAPIADLGAEMASAETVVTETIAQRHDAGDVVIDLPTEDHLEELGLVREMVSGEADVPQELAEIEKEELPDWLKKAAQAEGFLDEIAGGEVQETTVAEVEYEEAVPTMEAQESIDEIIEAEDDRIDEESPDWLELLQQERAPQHIVPERLEGSAVPKSQLSVSDEEELEIPDWLQILRQGQPETSEVSLEAERQPQASEGQVPEDTGRPTGEMQPQEPPAEVTEVSEATPTAEPLVGEKEPAEELGEIKAALRRLFPGKKVAEEAISRYENAIKDNPGDHQSRWNLIEAYASLDQHAAAVTHCDQLVQSGEFIDKVIQYLEKLRNAGMTTRQVYQILGDAYFKQDRLPEAAEVYRKALSQLG